MSEPTISPPEPELASPLWGRNVKFIVALATLAVGVYFVAQFTTLIRLVVIAAMLAYILNPIVVLLSRRLPLRRSLVILLLYVGLAVAVVWALVALGLAGFAQVSSLIEQAPTLIERATAVVATAIQSSEPLFKIGPFSLTPSNIQWDNIGRQALDLIQPVLSQSGSYVRQFATATVGLLGNLIFVFFISIYIANEFPKLGGYVANFAQAPGYRQDAERLVRDFSRIWSAYLRGQVILGLIIFLVVWLGLAIVGVDNSLALGLISGFLEFVPNLGPIIGALLTIIVAFFQPENGLGLEAWQFALVVLVFMIAVQQVENTVLVPRIVGQALDLHPLIVLIGVYMGATLAGILGAVLAAPVVATIRLLGRYAWRKMLDLPPFPEPEAGEMPSAQSLRLRLRALTSAKKQTR